MSFGAHPSLVIGGCAFELRARLTSQLADGVVKIDDPPERMVGRSICASDLSQQTSLLPSFREGTKSRCWRRVYDPQACLISPGGWTSLGIVVHHDFIIHTMDFGGFLSSKKNETFGRRD